MSRYIDADALLMELDMTEDLSAYDAVVFEEMVNEQPTAEVVEVVRCRDCTWWKSIFSWNGKEHKVCVRESAEPPRESDDYCSFGERREDERLNKQTGCD